MSSPSTASSAALEDAVAAFFRATRRARGRASQRTAPGGMSLSQFQLAEPLLDGSQTIGALAEAAAVAPPTASRVLDGLAARGFVKRRRDAADRRTVVLELTHAGRAAAEQKRSEVEGARRRIAAAFEPSQQPVVADLLLRLAAVVEEL